MTEPSEQPKPKRRRGKGKRATRKEVIERIATVCKLVLLGAEHADLCEYASENWGGLSPAQVRRYHQHALKKFARTVEKDIGKNFSRHVLQRRALFARAMESGDWRTALAIADSEAKLLDLFPDKLDDLSKRLEALEKRQTK